MTMHDGDTEPDPTPDQVSKATELAAKQRQLILDADRAWKMPGGHARAMECCAEARQIGHHICTLLQEHLVAEIVTKWGVSLRCQRCGRRIGQDGKALP